MLSPLCRPAGQVFPAELSAQVSFQKRGQLVDGELSILTIDLENDLVTLLSSKSENGEDRLCVDRLLFFGQGNLTLKSLGVLYEDCGRAGVQARLAPEYDCSFHHVFHPLCSLSYFQDKEYVAPGSHSPAGTTHDCPGPAGNNRTEHYLAPALDCCAVKVDDGGSGLNLLALGGDVLEALAFEFDRIEPNVHDKLNTFTGRDAKGVATRKQFDQVAGHRSYGNPSRRGDGNAIARHFLCEHLVRDGFQVDNCTIERCKNLYLCHHSSAFSFSCTLSSSVLRYFMRRLMRLAIRSDCVPKTTWAILPRLITPEAPRLLRRGSSICAGSLTKRRSRVIQPSTLCTL